MSSFSRGRRRRGSVAKRRKVVQLLDDPLYVPLPVVNQILTYLDTVSLVRIASCNSAWHQQVYDDDAGVGKELWKEIEFMDTRRGKLVGDEFEKRVQDSKARHITDNQLAALLRRCKARERCQVLKLTGCIRLRGHGLMPLRGSTVLREMDLRLCGSFRGAMDGQEINFNRVVPILNSMPPIRADLATTANPGIFVVKFDRSQVPSSLRVDGEVPNFYELHDDPVADWLREHNDKLEEVVKEQHFACGYCRRDFSTLWESEPERFSYGMGYCEKCKLFVCNDCDDFPFLRECEDCALTCCQPIGPRQQGMCPKNRMIDPCAGCQYPCCEDCNDNYTKGVVCGNEDCCDWYCDTCCANTQTTHGRPCKNSWCDIWFCNKCISEKENHEQNCIRDSDEEEYSSESGSIEEDDEDNDSRGDEEDDDDIPIIQMVQKRRAGVH